MFRSLRLIAVMLFALSSLAQQQKESSAPPKPQTPTASKPSKAKPEPAPAEQSKEQAKAEQVTTPKEEPTPPAKSEGAGSPAANIRYDMTETAPVITHHQITVSGKLLRYTATVGRMPIKNEEGKTEALMFYVAYTLDGAEPGSRPVTFAFNGGPGSASIWLHMGALGPRKVILQPEGWMPPAPYRLEDNPYTPLDRTDLVLVDAIGTGFSRPADTLMAKKFWGIKGDVVAFGEFIRMYITRNERWSSPLFLLGESYGTTRSAGLAGYLSEKGISFNGIVLASTILRFQTAVTTTGNDQAYALTLPSYTMVAWYHKKLPADLMQDPAKTRAAAEQFARGEYTNILAKGDTLTPEERKDAAAKIARFTGLTPQDVDEANLRIDVRQFTHRLLAAEKLRVGRLDGRYSGPDPEGYLDTPFYDPTSSATSPPFTSMFNDYIRRELGFKTDMVYTVLNYQANQQWEWGNAAEGQPDTSTDLRAAMVKDPYLKVLVMEGMYDLATPFAAVHNTMDHLDLTEKYRQNISFADYQAGHMFYVRQADLQKMKQDFSNFISTSVPK